MGIIKFILRAVLIGFIFMVMRSPIAMLLVGITSGIFFYHLYPNKAQEGVHFVQSGFGLIMDKVYATPVVDLVPEDRSEYRNEYQEEPQSRPQDEYQYDYPVQPTYSGQIN